MKLDKITIKVGEPGEQFLLTNSLSRKSNVQRQPAGLNFYRYRWSSSDRGEVELDHGEYSFLVPNSLSLQGTEDEDNLSDGIFAYSINFGFAGGGDVSHDLVRKEFLSFLDHLTSLGWARVIAYSDPRLTGMDAYRFHKNDSFYSFPMDYKPSLEEWMALDDLAQWSLRAEGVFIDIEFHRDRKKMDPEGLGTYLFVMKIKSAEEFAKRQFKPESRDKWFDLWEDQIRMLKRQRYTKEEQVKNAGGSIDTDYRDPIVHPKDPIELEE